MDPETYFKLGYTQAVRDIKTYVVSRSKLEELDKTRLLDVCDALLIKAQQHTYIKQVSQGIV